MFFGSVMQPCLTQPCLEHGFLTWAIGRVFHKPTGPGPLAFRECCKYDGQAAVARWEGDQPIYNPRLLAFCAHYEMRPWALRGNPNLRPNTQDA